MVLWISNHIELLLEIIAVISGIIYVFLAAKNNNWCWIFGILGSAISIILFVVYAKLYAEAILYFFYVLAGIYGWLSWKKQPDTQVVYQHSWKKHVLVIAIGIMLSFGLYYTITYFFTDAEKPLIDAFTTVFSFIATYLTAKKWLENWIYWIVIDFISTFLYYSRGLEIYALLMFAYTFIAIYGYLQWKKLTVEKG